MRGKFITIEGCDGVGKSTHIRMLRETLEAKKADYVFTREPGGTEISERIRDIISDPSYADMDSYTELLLYAAARRQHTVEFISKQLESGKLVFCDRYADSTLCYQGYGRGIDKTVIDFCNKIALGDITIDLTLFFDLPPEDAFARKGGADLSDRLERENFEFYKRVYNGYKQLSSLPRVATIDARGSKIEVHNRVIKALEARGIL